MGMTAKNTAYRFASGSLYSQKLRFVNDATIASFSVTDDSGGWRSVVARGPFSKILEPAVSDNVVKSIRQMNIPYVLIHEE